MRDTIQPLRPTTVHDASEAFLSHLRYKQRAPGTIKQYRPVLRAFSEWAGDRAAGSLTSFEIEGGFLPTWIADFTERNGREPSGNTIRGVVGALKSLFKYLTSHGLLLDDGGRSALNPMLAIDSPAVRQKTNDWLRPSEDQALLDAPMSDDEQIVVWLLRWTGLRIGEATSLLVRDVDLDEGNVHVRESKTERGLRTVPIVPELRPRITRWLYVLDERGLLRPTTPFLATRNGTRWSTQYADKLVKRVAARAGVRAVECTCGTKASTRHAKGCPRTANGQRLSDVSPHTLRRTFGTHFLNQGVSLNVVSALLGHSSTEITEKAYAELLSETIRREMLAALTG